MIRSCVKQQQQQQQVVVVVVVVVVLWFTFVAVLGGEHLRTTATVYVSELQWLMQLQF